MDAAVASMTTLNKSAAECSRRYAVHAATDVTGFSFLGHLHEMMGGRLSCRIDASAVPVLPGAWQAADDCLLPPPVSETATTQAPSSGSRGALRHGGDPFRPSDLGRPAAGGRAGGRSPLETELKGVGLPAAIVGEITERQDTEILVSYPEYSKPIF